MLFKKENQIINIKVGKGIPKDKIGLATFEDGEKLKIKGVNKLETTLERIEFLENKGFRIY